MRNVSDKRFRENQNMLFVFNNFSLGNSALCGSMRKKYFRTSQVTDDYIAQALCMLGI